MFQEIIANDCRQFAPVTFGKLRHFPGELLRTKVFRRRVDEVASKPDRTGHGLDFRPVSLSGENQSRGVPVAAPIASEVVAAQCPAKGKCRRSIAINVIRETAIHGGRKVHRQPGK